MDTKNLFERIALVSTCHEPKGSLEQALKEKVVPLVEENNIEWYVNATESTKKEFYNYIEKDTSIKINTKKDILGIEGFGIEEDHISALVSYLKNSKKEFMLYTDLDRLSMAFAYFTNETLTSLEKIISKSDKNKIINVVRSDYAMKTHHIPLRLTEETINHFYSKVFDIPVDPGSTSWLINKDSAEFIVDKCNKDYSNIKIDFPHPKFMLMLLDNNKKLDSIIVDNMLRYEAPEQRRGANEIKVENHEWSPEGYEKVCEIDKKLNSEKLNSKKEWDKRIITMHQYIGVLDELYLKRNNIYQGKKFIKIKEK